MLTLRPTTSKLFNYLTDWPSLLSFAPPQKLATGEKERERRGEDELSSSSSARRSPPLFFPGGYHHPCSLFAVRLSHTLSLSPPNVKNSTVLKKNARPSCKQGRAEVFARKFPHPSFLPPTIESCSKQLKARENGGGGGRFDASSKKWFFSLFSLSISHQPSRQRFSPARNSLARPSRARSGIFCSRPCSVFHCSLAHPAVAASLAVPLSLPP